MVCHKWSETRQSKDAEIKQGREEYEKFDNEQKSLEQEKAKYNENFKINYRNLTKELRDAIGARKKAEKDMQATKEEKAKLQEQLKQIEPAQHQTEGEFSGQSTADQVVQGALETIKRMSR